MSQADRKRDRRLLLWLMGSVFVLIVAISVLTPRRDEQDKRPTAENAGSAGAKAALLTLQAMGRNAVAWDEPADHIGRLDAARSTLVLAEPNVAMVDRPGLVKALKSFLQHGGRVLLTGAGERAQLLTGGRTETPAALAPKFCETTPEGPGPLAAAGSVQMAFEGSWVATGPQFRVEQRCGGNAVVVRYPVGAGEAVWWSSATPLTNAGLRRDANLKLLLASLYFDGGDGRTVYFDQYYFGQHATATPWTNDSRALWAMFWQFALLFGLMVWSFSRRKGPLRMPVEVPRSSPVEFAESMGGLYAKARATGPVVEAAQRRLESVLMREAGLSREVVRSGPEAVGEALASRFGGDWGEVRKDLERAVAARDEALSAGDALRLVRAMGEDEERLRAMLAAGMSTMRDKELVGVGEESSGR